MQLITPTKPLLAGLMLLAATQAHAKLTSYTANGTDLVYSSVSDVTWTKDANLLGSMFASQGFDTVVNAIIAASPTISNTPNPLSPSGIYTLSGDDFSISGRVSWFGAIAFINYLNNINYAGSNQWRLPIRVTNDAGYNVLTNGALVGDEYAELYYNELGSKAYYDLNSQVQAGWGIRDLNNFFVNEKTYAYWYGTEARGSSWYFNMYDGVQSFVAKDEQYYAWAISPGQITVVPEPESVVMMLAGVGFVGVVLRRRQHKQPFKA